MKTTQSAADDAAQTPAAETAPAPPPEIRWVDTSGEAEIPKLAIVRDYGGEVLWLAEGPARAEIAAKTARLATDQDLAVAGLARS